MDQEVKKNIGSELSLDEADGDTRGARRGGEEPMKTYDKSIGSLLDLVNPRLGRNSNLRGNNRLDK